MINHEVIQGSEEWFKIRIGVITASTFKELVDGDGNPKEGRKKGSKSAMATSLENRIVAEIITGEVDEPFFTNHATERGKNLEAEARRMYEMLKGVEVKRSGFVTNDACTVGGSADGLVGNNGGLEIKCLYGKNHVSMLFEKEIDAEHKPQVQGLLMITGCDWWETMAYHPKMPPSIIPTGRDEQYIKNLSATIDEALFNIGVKVAAIKDRLYT